MPEGDIPGDYNPVPFTGIEKEVLKGDKYRPDILRRRRFDIEAGIRDPEDKLN